MAERAASPHRCWKRRNVASRRFAKVQNLAPPDRSGSEPGGRQTEPSGRCLEGGGILVLVVETPSWLGETRKPNVGPALFIDLLLLFVFLGGFCQHGEDMWGRTSLGRKGLAGVIRKCWTWLTSERGAENQILAVQWIWISTTNPP